jgi:hypothetical protein
LEEGTYGIRLEATTNSGLANIDKLTISGNEVEAADCDDDDDDDDGATCEDPDEIDTYIFKQDGVGEYCWVTPYKIVYVNSWGTESITINGEDFTNRWSTSLPDPIDGKYYIHYKASYEWSHLDVVGDGDMLEE